MYFQLEVGQSYFGSNFKDNYNLKSIITHFHFSLFLLKLTKNISYVRTNIFPKFKKLKTSFYPSFISATDFTNFDYLSLKTMLVCILEETT